MKKHHLIFITVLAVIILFYKKYVALNLGILGIFLSILTFTQTKSEFRTKMFLTLFVTSIFSSFAFAWFGDAISFVAVLVSVFLLRFKGTYPKLKPFLYIEVLLVSLFSFLGRVFYTEQWFEKPKEGGGFGKKLITFILIPGILITIFLCIYSAGSSHFDQFFSEIKLDFSFFDIIILAIIGFYVGFIFWNFGVERFIFKQNRYLNDDFSGLIKIQKPTFSFLDIDSERTSGLISFSALNILLLIFIATYNYEQFFEVTKSADGLSAETHERVNSVIMSIVMAILVILFYFKRGFNFDEKAKSLKISAKIWIVLNAVLVISASLKNSEYIINFGLTYKRLGVYAFLTMALIGLIFTFIKIQNKKTNVFLFNKMFWTSYGLILVCSYVNWGGIITSNDIKRKDFADNYHLCSINYNEKILLDYAEKTGNSEMKNKLIERIESYQQETFLSKILYYETINLDRSKIK
ncbi:DUF4173 domain-containing protein [Epilithonimonas ginsengisoli]|uniref:DUF4173 domain-containing protein n=1 Tax=Epilithonimonas ginsengisoli TaxID=1245592 RepID=A0ABU4JI33_9FLAO|nr:MULTISPECIES: DUF4173 domain-containing protein [Chryseobacterium group]MBV6879897.1 DUF4173 domain-containing protein [Epilithonimonas sp. FP105]MDW8549342.1 DUF4173 domain-containing protein [Epilithonimonas ginsengisoli]OAH70229.1 beta-carotene 15,15'-monooxygenase [Chryseobacterium sp. FP211-J200]